MALRQQRENDHDEPQVHSPSNRWRLRRPRGDGLHFTGDAAVGRSAGTRPQFLCGPNGQLDAGVWECAPNKHVYEAAPYDEFVYLLEGRIDVIDDQGAVETFTAGDSFILPRGCACTWDVKEPVRKLYVVLTAEAYRD